MLPEPKITTGISGDDQESNFMNSTLNYVNGLAVSVAVELPDHMEDMSEEQIIAELRKDFSHLTQIGYDVEIQVGKDEDDG